MSPRWNQLGVYRAAEPLASLSQELSSLRTKDKAGWGHPLRSPLNLSSVLDGRGPPPTGVAVLPSSGTLAGA